MRVPARIWGPASGLGLATAAIIFAVDQAYKYWALHIYRLAERGVVEITPFLNLVMVWNPGVSYGLFEQDTDLGRWVLIAFNVLASIGLFVWLARQHRGWDAFSIGLVIGGALGNALDRAIYGAVADFFSLHALGYYWYVFNIADVAIVVGVAMMLIDALRPAHRRPSDV